MRRDNDSEVIRGLCFGGSMSLLHELYSILRIHQKRLMGTCLQTAQMKEVRSNTDDFSLWLQFVHNSR